MIDWNNPTPADMERLAAELSRIGRNPNIITLQTHGVIGLIAMIQLALRHPSATNHPFAKACEAAARMMLDEIAIQSPLVAEYLGTGWNRVLDR